MSASSGNRSTATALLVAAAICAGCASPAGSPEPKAAGTLSEWGPCAPTEPAGVECSTLTVPFDYARPDERTFTIPLVRIAARGEKPRLLLTNPGGPGISGVGDLRSNREYFAGFTDTHAVVSFDARGVGGSEPALSCLDDQQRQAIFNQPSVPTTEPQMTRAAELAAGIGDACERRFADALAHVGTADVARDMDEIRKALGFERIDRCTPVSASTPGSAGPATTASGSTMCLRRRISRSASGSASSTMPLDWWAKLTTRAWWQ